MCDGGGSPATSLTTEKAEPWGPQIPYLKRGFKEAEQNVLNRPLEFFPGSTVTPFAPETEAGLSKATARATEGSPVIGAAEGELQRTLGGDYLSADNPYTSALTDQIAGDVGAAVDSRFSLAGRQYGSPGHVEAVSRGIADAVAPFQFGNYSAERGRMGEQLKMAPAIGAQPYQDAQALLGVGAEREGLSRAGLSENVARHQFAQTEPIQRIENYMRLVQGNYGGQRTSTGTAQPATGGFGDFLGDLTLGAVGAGAGQKGLGTVICSAAYAHGLIDDVTYQADSRYGEYLLRHDSDVLAGYWLWAEPIAARMRKSKFFARFVYFFAAPVIKEIAHHGGMNGWGTMTGHLMLAIGLPLCRMIGKRRKDIAQLV